MLVRNYSEVVKAVEELRQGPWQTTLLTQADGYPLFVLTSAGGRTGSGMRPSLLVAAGIHGEEPAGVVGLMRWLLERSSHWLDRLHLTVFPCLNPWGYERGIRFGSHGRDLNREFDRPEHPAVRAFKDWVAGKQYDLFMDLHEDSDFRELYLYELLDPLPSVTPTLGRRILKRLGKQVPLSDGDDVGGLVTAQGMVGGQLSRAQAAGFEGRPIAIDVYAYNTPHVVTLETPGMLALDLRARLHVEALEEACAYLCETARTG